jgi:hypothetical protein
VIPALRRLFNGPSRQRNLSYLALAAYLLAQFGRGTGSTLLPFDSLDIITPIFSTLTAAQLFGPSDAIVPNVMGGIPLWALLGAGPLNLVADANVFLGGFFALVVIESTIRILALWAMSRLLVTFTGIKDLTVAWGVSLCFAILPICYPLLGVMLLTPLVALSFLELLSGRQWWWAAGLIAYPLFCPLPLGFPVFFLLGGIALYCCANKRALIPQAAFILVLFATFYAAVEYRILLQVFFHQGFISHRIERGWPLFDMMAALIKMRYELLTGTGEIFISSCIFPFILLNVIWVLCAPRRYLTKFPRPLWLFIALHISMAVLSAFWFTSPFLAFQDWLGITNLNIGRFIYLWPILLYTIWALALTALPSKRPYRLAVIAVQFTYLCIVSQALSAFFDPHAMSYEQFFSPRLFAKVRDAIGEPQSSYRVVSLGLPPNVPLYSGFYTLDGYLNNYPLEYKHRFRSVIAPDLDQSDHTAAMVRSRIFGNLLNIYAGDIGWYYFIDIDIAPGEAQYRLRQAPPIHMESDLSGFYPFGARYLLSAVEIADAWKNGLTLMGVFADDNSPYVIRLYRIHKPVG